MLRARFVWAGKEPTTVLRVTVTELFMQCAKSMVRSALWEGRPRPAGLPTMGQLIAAHARTGMDPVEYDRAAPARIKETLY